MSSSANHSKKIAGNDWFREAYFQDTIELKQKIFIGTTGFVKSMLTPIISGRKKKSKNYVLLYPLLIGMLEILKSELVERGGQTNFINHLQKKAIKKLQKPKTLGTVIYAF